MSKAKITTPVTKAAFKYFRQGGGENTICDLHSALNKLGWKLLNNNGSFSVIYWNPRKSYVLKINRVEDDSYQNYVKLIHTYSNKHFPRIGDMKVLRIGKINYYVYLIEKLQTLPKAGAISYIIDRAFNALDSSEDFSEKGCMDALKQEFNGRLPKILKDKSLIDAIRLLTIDTTIFWDMHSENIMLRKDGTIVIIDPYM